MFETPEDYYALKPRTRKLLVEWFSLASLIVATLRSEENYEDDAIIKTLRAVISKKNLKYIDCGN